MKKLIATAAAALAGFASANAANLDFLAEYTPAAYVGAPNLTLVNATITSDGADMYVFGASQGSNPPGPLGGFCAVTSIAGGDCSTDIEITFDDAPISNLVFTSSQYNSGDRVQASVFNSMTLLSSVLIDSDTTVNFAGITGITRLVLDDLGSTGAGLAYGAFQFEVDGAIPVPAAAPLMMAGLAGIGWMRKRKAA